MHERVGRSIGVSSGQVHALVNVGANLDWLKTLWWHFPPSGVLFEVVRLILRSMDCKLEANHTSLICIFDFINGHVGLERYPPVVPLGLVRVCILPFVFVHEVRDAVLVEAYWLLVIYERDKNAFKIFNCLVGQVNSLFDSFVESIVIFLRNLGFREVEGHSSHYDLHRELVGIWQSNGLADLGNQLVLD